MSFSEAVAAPAQILFFNQANERALTIVHALTSCTNFSLETSLHRSGCALPAEGDRQESQNNVKGSGFRELVVKYPCMQLALL